jgi:predicted ATPase
MGKLNRIKLKGYKSIKEMDLSLSSLNVLIGANGAGKTNLISTFTLLNELVNKRLNVFVGRSGRAETLLHFGQKTTEKIEIELDFGANSYQATLLPTDDDSLIFEREFAIFNQPTQYQSPVPKSLGSGHAESNLSKYAEEYKSAVPKYVRSAFLAWRVYHFHDTSSSAKVRKAGEINDNVELRADAANLAAFLYRLQVQFPDNYKLIVRTIQLVAPFFDDFILRPDPLNENSIRLEWKEVNSDVYMNAMSLSDGTLRFICLATVLQQPSILRPETVIIDEPELGLHPFAIVQLSSLIKQAASKMQVIVSTQSVQLVNQFDPADLVIVNLVDGASEFHRLAPESIDEWLANYSLGELWEKNVLGGRP